MSVTYEGESKGFLVTCDLPGCETGIFLGENDPCDASSWLTAYHWYIAGSPTASGDRCPEHYPHKVSHEVEGGQQPAAGGGSA